MYFFGSKQYRSHSDWYRNTVYFCISFLLLSSKSQRSKEIWHGQARLARSRLLDSLTPNVVSDIDVFLVLWPCRKPAHRQCTLVPLLSNKGRKKKLRLNVHWIFLNSRSLLIQSFLGISNRKNRLRWNSFPVRILTVEQTELEAKLFKKFWSELHVFDFHSKNQPAF